MPRKTPDIVIRTYDVTAPVGVYDPAKAAWWEDRRRTEAAGRLIGANARTGTVVEGAL